MKEKSSTADTRESGKMPEVEADNSNNFND